MIQLSTSEQIELIKKLNTLITTLKEIEKDDFIINEITGEKTNKGKMKAIFMIHELRERLGFNDPEIMGEIFDIKLSK